ACALPIWSRALPEILKKLILVGGVQDERAEFFELGGERARHACRPSSVVEPAPHIAVADLPRGYEAVLTSGVETPNWKVGAAGAAGSRRSHLREQCPHGRVPSSEER